MRATTAVLAVLTLAAVCLQPSAATVPSLTPTSVVQSANNGTAIITYDMHITVAQAAPDCYQKATIRINGLFMPTIEVHTGDTLRIHLYNDIPASFPLVTDGISIHWHGFGMYGPAAWYDGVNYVAFCPLSSGKRYDYEFKVMEAPGTYFWHDHGSALRADGFQGALIVRPRRSKPVDLTAPEERIMFLSDWHHGAGNALLMQLNRPFDPVKVTNDSGAWQWVGNPQGMLLNGKGYFMDCQQYPGLGQGPAALPCNASTFTVGPGRSVQQPWASPANPGCTHETFSVVKDKTYRFRIINAGTLVYMTVCFEGHNVTIVAADAIPTDPLSSGSCVDVNTGQRLDVLLTANKAVDNYWISVTPQYRPGAVSGYAVLNYAGANTSTFPTTPTPQGNQTAWTIEQTNRIHVAKELLGPQNENSTYGPDYLPFGMESLAVPSSNKTVIVDLTQPLIDANGILRWALNNVAMPTTPSCEPILPKLRKNPKYLDKFRVTGAYNGTQGMININVGNGPAVVYNQAVPAPQFPSVGLHIVELKHNEVIDVVLNNRAANYNNGDTRGDGVGAARNATEQHSFHLHGHHFWFLGSGMGVYSPQNNSASLNTQNPAFRDTLTVPQGGWAVLRFIADNPGVWPFHCHIMWHQFMGQQLYFVEAPDMIDRGPGRNVPKCKKQCRYNFAPYNKEFVRSIYGNSGFELPPV